MSRKTVVEQTTFTERSLRLGVGILAFGAAVLLLYYGRIFFITVIIASMIAFLLDPVVVAFMKLRLPRGLASFVVCSIALVALYLIGLGVYTQALAIAEDLPAYSLRINDLVDSASRRMEDVENTVYQTIVPKRLRTPATPEPAPDAAAGAKGKRNKRAEPPPAPAAPAVQEVHIQQDPTPIYNYVYAYLRQFYDALLMASFVPFLVYFLLSWRDHLRVRFLLIFDDANRGTAADTWSSVGEMVRAYVIGNFMLGILLSACSALLFAAVKLPYWLMVAPASGFLSLVPYVGLPLAMGPPLIAALPAAKAPAMYLFLIVSVAMLHLLALNLLYPKFVGARVHLNPLAVTVALMFWGMMWGAIGLVLAIPITAAIKAVCDSVATLKPYGRLLGD